jgi:vanadium-dependent haloperoxidase-like protein
MNLVKTAITATWFLLSVPMAGRADVITDWNLAATNATANLGPVVQARVLATAHGAAFDAVNAIERRYAPNLREFKPSKNTSADAAAAAALHGVLVTMLPALKNTFDEQLGSTLAKILDGPAKDAGIAFGTQVAQAYVEYRSKDGMTATAEHKAGMNPGQWRPTPPGNAPMAAPQLADVLPFTTKKFDFLQVKGPPALDSAAYARDVDEVRRLGARTSTERNADQTVSAIFWYISTPIPWEAAARAGAQKFEMKLVDSARLFALMNMVGMDAYIAGWQIKRKTSFWRPITAIHEASVNSDALWEPLLTTPPHPDYPSGHNINSGAMAQAIRKLIGTDEIAFSAGLTLPPGALIRNWQSLSEAEKDVMGARIWAGIHFRSADEDGIELGHAIADHAVSAVMRPAVP